MYEETVQFEIKRNDTVGRYAVASRDLESGNEILTEVPFAYGPKTDSPPVCLGCYAPVDCTILCSDCKWPVCNSDCQRATVHKEGECMVFANAKVKFIPVKDTTECCLQYECVTPLRVLLAMEKNKEIWDKEVNCMQSHTEERQSQEIWRFNQINIVNYLRGPCRLQKFDEKLIHKVCGILDVNTFEARTRSGNSIRCLYPKASVFSHNCVTNIVHSIFSDGYGPEKDYRIVVRSAVPLKKGSELFARYAYSTWPTIFRRQFIKQSKYFECNCERCADPTELGTHMSTVKCAECSNGLVLSINPLNSDSDWKCTLCANILKASIIKEMFQAIQTEIEKTDVIEQGSLAIDSLENLFRKYSSILHPNNGFLTMIRISLAQMYGRINGYKLDTLPDLLYERKIDLCKNILEIIDVIEPGYSRLRGIILYEIHAPIIFHSKNLFNKEVIDKNELCKRLKEAMGFLQEASEILLFEPEDSNEGMLGNFAKKTFQKLVENFEEIVNTA